MAGAIAVPAWYMGIHDTPLLPKFPGGISLSCHGFCSPIPGLFTLVSAKLPSHHSATILYTAWGHAELGTKGGLPQQPRSLCVGAEAPACPQPNQLCQGKGPTSIPHCSPHLPWLPWSGEFPSLCHVLAEIPHPGVPAASPSPSA